MSHHKQLLLSFLDAYNCRDVITCAKYFTNDVELWSSYVKHLFPESDGIIRGKEQLIEYLNWLFHELENTAASHYELDERNDFIIVRAENDTGDLNYYLHYYLNDEGLIYLIKSNLTRPSNL